MQQRVTDREGLQRGRALKDDVRLLRAPVVRVKHRVARHVFLVSSAQRLTRADDLLDLRDLFGEQDVLCGVFARVCWVGSC